MVVEISYRDSSMYYTLCLTEYGVIFLYSVNDDVCFVEAMHQVLSILLHP